jgi:hypothetical protein
LKISIAQKGLLRQALANLNGNVDIAENKFSSPVTSKDLQKDTKLKSLDIFPFVINSEKTNDSAIPNKNFTTAKHA